MILIHVGGLLGEPTGSIRLVAVEATIESAYDPALELGAPLSGAVQLQRTNRGVLASGQVTTTLARTCGRCLDPFVEPATVSLAEEFLPSIDHGSGRPVELEPEDEGVRRIDGHHQIDLWPVIAEELLLAEPAQLRCRPDCPGLCPVCGRHLDRGSCDCQREEDDPRLAVLADFLPGAEE